MRMPGRGFPCALGLVLMIKLLAVSAGNDDESDEYKPAYGEMMEWSRNDYYVRTNLLSAHRSLVRAASAHRSAIRAPSLRQQI